MCVTVMATDFAKMASGVWNWGTDVPGNWSHRQELEITTDGDGCWIQREEDDERVVSRWKGLSRWVLISRSLSAIPSHNETGTAIVGEWERGKWKLP